MGSAVCLFFPGWVFFPALLYSNHHLLLAIEAALLCIMGIERPLPEGSLTVVVREALTSFSQPVC